MNMTSDLSLQESCMAALRHMSVEVRALVDKTNELEAENEKLRRFAKSTYRHICAQERYLRGSGYDSFDYFDTVARELRIE